MHEPLVSVVMPVYNHADFVREAVDSVLDQTVDDLELLIIDDGSTDESWQAVGERADERITAVQQDNRGAHAAINRGLGVARGRYLSIINSDDRWLPQRLEKMLALHREDQSPCLLFSSVGLIDAVGGLLTGPERAYYDALQMACLHADPRNWFLRGNIAMTSSNFFFPRELWRLVGGFRNLRYTHDWDWALRSLKRGPPRRHDESLVEYRFHPKNTLKEGDVWRHITENAFILASHLHRANVVYGPDIHARLEAWVAMMACSPTFFPVVTVMLASLAGNAEEESVLLESIAGDGFRHRIRGVLESNGFSGTDLFLSLAHLRDALKADRGPADG